MEGIKRRGRNEGGREIHHGLHLRYPFWPAFATVRAPVHSGGGGRGGGRDLCFLGPDRRKSTRINGGDDTVSLPRIACRHRVAGDTQYPWVREVQSLLHYSIIPSFVWRGPRSAKCLSLQICLVLSAGSRLPLPPPPPLSRQSIFPSSNNAVACKTVCLRWGVGSTQGTSTARGPSFFAGRPPFLFPPPKEIKSGGKRGGAAAVAMERKRQKRPRAIGASLFLSLHAPSLSPRY